MKNKHVIVAGMPRSATTYLYNVLQKHPDVFTPYLKEVNYFLAHYDRGESWYRGLFKKARPEQTTFDVSPASFLDSQCDDRILECCPDAKIVVLVRDPMEWCLSFYSQFKSFDYKTPPFDRFIHGHRYEIGSYNVAIGFQDNFVPKRIAELMNKFGDRVLLISYRMMKADPLLVLGYVEQFCGLRPFFTRDNVFNVKINASGRRNVRLVSYLLSRDWLIRSIGSLGLGAVAQRIRPLFDRFAASHVIEHEALYSEQELDLNRAAFADQQAWVDDLFRDTLALLGSGKPYLRKRASGS